MKTKALTEAKDPDLRGSAAAMRRAAQLARETAIQSIRVIRGIRGGTFGNSCSFVSLRGSRCRMDPSLRSG